MKLSSIFLITGLLLLMSMGCSPKVSKQSQSSKKVTNAKVVQHYNSTANDLAEIYLKLFDNNTFELYFKSLDDDVSGKYAGDIQVNNSDILLKFGDKRPDLESLFDESYDHNNAFKVIDSRTVSIKKSADIVFIWGVSCTKK